jgi:hypothetical protein
MNRGCWWVSQKERGQWKDQEIRWMDNIKAVIDEIGWVIWTGFIRLRLGKSGVLCKYGNELHGYIKRWEVLE